MDYLLVACVRQDTGIDPFTAETRAIPVGRANDFYNLGGVAARGASAAAGDAGRRVSLCWFARANR